MLKDGEASGNLEEQTDAAQFSERSVTARRERELLAQTFIMAEPNSPI